MESSTCQTVISGNFFSILWQSTTGHQGNLHIGDDRLLLGVEDGSRSVCHGWAKKGGARSLS